MADRPIPDARAYDYYIRARYEILQFSNESLERALKLLQKGLDIVGENVLLLAGKGYAYLQFFNSGIKADEAVLQAAEECAARIFNLQPESVYGYRLLGLVQVSRGNIKEKVRYLKRALAVDPNDLDALMWLSLIYAVTGKSQAAQPLISQLLEIDPLTPSNHMFAAGVQFYDGEFAAALASMRTAYELEPENVVHRFFCFLFLAASRRFEEAFALVDLLMKDTPDTFSREWRCFCNTLCKERVKRLSVCLPKNLLAPQRQISNIPP